MTAMASVPSIRIKSLLSNLGLLDGFTIDETGVTYAAPIFQSGYPIETAKNVESTSSIMAVQTLGPNDNPLYFQDLNVRLHLWTPTNGTAVYPYYEARMQEIELAIKGQDYGGVWLISGGYMTDGDLDSGRRAYHIDMRVVIGDLD